MKCCFMCPRRELRVHRAGIIMGLGRALAGFMERTTRELSKVEPQNCSLCSLPCRVDLDMEILNPPN